MHLSWLSSAFLLLTAAASCASPTANTPTQVNVRIEGAQKTIFEGNVLTTGHNVTTPSGGNHKCDGTNGAAHTSPGPTPLSALDDAAKQNGFSFDGLFVSGFDDFIIGTIAGESSDNIADIWISGLNFFSQGIFETCKTELNAGDKVLFALVSVGVQGSILQLIGPTTARVNQPVTFTVVGSVSLFPIQGATVNGVTTDANGHATLTFTQTGLNSAKADKPGSVRSNRVDIQVTN